VTRFGDTESDCDRGCRVSRPAGHVSYAPSTNDTMSKQPELGSTGSHVFEKGGRSHDGAVKLDDLGIAHAAQHAAEARLAASAAAPDVAVRGGRGWFAVRTGVDSNDMNAVISTRQAEIPNNWSRI
jgi:hypothetical protein